MASNHHSLSSEKNFKLQQPNKLRIGVLVSDYNHDITHTMRDACVETLQQYGVLSQHIFIQAVPGAFELPLSAMWLYEKAQCDALICIGCVIKGETDHDIYINHTVANALQQLSLQNKTPFVFGILTPNTHQQAKERAGGKHGNKGVECALTALQMLSMKGA